MKYTAPRPMAVLLAALIALLTGILTIMFVFTKTSNFYELWIVYVLSVFIIFYVILYYALNNFIIHRIRPIYKTIHNINIPDKEIREKLEDKDIISVVDQEVREWARTKTLEIDQLKKLEQYRKEFLGNVSHELKTPIFNIQGYVLTLLDGGIDDKNINIKYLERTEKSLNRLISIVNDLETISRLESAELHLELSKFDIVVLVEEVFEMYEITAQKKNIKLRLRTPDNRPVMVHANREKIFDVVTNLVSNSIKYGKKDGHTFVDFLDMDNRILIEIEDDGIGIAEEDLPRVFERFYRVDKSRSREQGGTGLGLAIVKHIIEAHKQTINCRSSAGKGTSFAFTLRNANT
ncbi:MAG: sensor histidine kinase [Bacteroidales bacterium]|nr:sensor histidine kinase [Bacteroidales bacterium]MCF8457634.1 sensor histidine kinase [Bacteroidales bacterium]